MAEQDNAATSSPSDEADRAIIARFNARQAKGSKTDDSNINADIKRFDISPSQPIPPTKIRTSLAATTGGSSSVTDEQIVARFNVRESGGSKSDQAAALLGQKSIKGATLPAWDRIKIAWLSDTFAERKAKFEKIYPSGTLRIPEGTGIEVYKKTPGEDYLEVDRSLMDTVSDHFAHKIVETAIDVAEFVAGPLPQMIGEAAAAIGAARIPGLKIVGGAPARIAKLLTQEVITAGGGAAGNAVSQAIQTATGVQRQTIEQQLQQGGMEALAGAGIGLATRGVAGAVSTSRNIIKGRPLVASLQGAEAAQAATAELRREGFDIPRLIPPQTSGSPIAQMVGKRAGRIVGTIRDYVDRQEKGLVAVLESLRRPEDMKRFATTARDELERVNNDLLTVMRDGLKHEQLTARDATIALKAAADAHKKGTGIAVQKAYQQAEVAGEPVFDVRRWDDSIGRMLEGSFARGKSKRIQKRDDFGAAQFYDNGNPIMEVVDSDNIPILRAEGKLRSKLQDMLNIRDDIPANPSQVTGEMITSTQQLNDLKSGLYDLSITQNPSGIRNANEKMALDAYRSVVDVLDNAVHPNARSRELYEIASDMAKTRFETFETTAVMQLMRSNTPDAFVRNLWKRDSLSDLINVRSAMSDRQFGLVMQAFRSEAVERVGRDPASFIASLDSLDDATRSFLLTGTEERFIRTAAKQKIKLDSSSIGQALENQSRTHAMVKETIEGGLRKTNNVEILKQLAQEGSSFAPGQGFRNTKFGKTIRAGIVDYLFEKSALRGPGTDGVERIVGTDAKIWADTYRKLGKAGFLDFFTPRDELLIGHADKVRAFMNNASGSAGLEAAQVGGEVLQPGVFLRSLTESAGLSYSMIHNPIIFRIFGTGSGGAPVPVSQIWQALGHAFGTASADMSDQKEMASSIEKRKRISGLR